MAVLLPKVEKAGMTRVDVEENESLEKDLRKLERIGFNRKLLNSRSTRPKLSLISEGKIWRRAPALP